VALQYNNNNNNNNNETNSQKHLSRITAMADHRASVSAKKKPH
jgi:hypothetical protein